MQLLEDELEKSEDRCDEVTSKLERYEAECDEKTRLVRFPLLIMTKLIKSLCQETCGVVVKSQHWLIKCLKHQHFNGGINFRINIC